VAFSGDYIPNDIVQVRGYAGGVGSLSPGGAILDVAFGLVEDNIGDCVGVIPSISLVDFGLAPLSGGWITTISALAPDPSDTCEAVGKRSCTVWRSRLRLDANSSGQDREFIVALPLTRLGTEVSYFRQEIPHGCFPSLFDAVEVPMSATGQGAAVHIEVTNTNLTPCDFRLVATVHFITQLPTVIEENGTTRTSPNGTGTVAPGATARLTVTLSGTGNDVCQERLGWLQIAIENFRQRSVPVRQAVIVGPPGRNACFDLKYDRIRATPGGPSRQKPPACVPGTLGCSIGSGVRG
jgi:hypothetical protein